MRPDEIIADFSAHQQAIGQAASTVRDYPVLIRRFFAFLETHGMTDLDSINGRLLLQYQIHVAGLLNKRGRPYSPGHQNLHIRALRVLFNYLCKLGKMSSNPAISIKLAKEPQPLPKVILSVDETFTMLDSVDTRTVLGLRDKAIGEVLYGSGIRKAELIRLNIEDINASDLTIMVRRGKGGDDRVALLTPQAMYWLQRYLDEARPKLAGENAGDAVFISQKTRERLCKQGLKYIVERMRENAGIKKLVTPHTFRHSIATHLLNNGAGLPHLQRFLGHKRLATTIRYTHLAVDDLKKVHAQCHPRSRAA